MNQTSMKLDHEQRANQTAMLRLLGALVRERLFSTECEVNQLHVPFAKEIARRFPTQKRLLLITQTKSGDQLYVPIGHVGAFQRFKLLAPIWFRSKKRWLCVDRLKQMIKILREHFDVHIPKSLESELFNSLHFSIYGYQQRAKQFKNLRERLRPCTVQSTPYPEAIMQLKEKEPFDEYLFSEAMAVEGNPLHPCAKTRVGLAFSERQYLPESCSPVPLRVLLIPKDHVQLTSVIDEDINQFLFRLEPTLEKVAQQACADKGVALAQYQLFFVHPWQFEHVINKQYRHVMADWLLLPFTLNSRALLSLRTMDVTPLGIHLKLPVQLQITNAVRTLSPQATVNGPLLSRLCNQLLAKEQDYSERLVVLPELAGAYYRRQDGENFSFYARNLSFTIRQHPQKYIYDGEMAFVGAALAEKTPFGQPLILELMQQAVGKKEVTASDAIGYLTHYAQRCLPPLLYLLQAYGLALEGHMQNVVVVVKNGHMQRLLVRDMGGLRIHRKRFQQKVGEMGLQDGPIFVDKMSDVYKKFLHSVIQNHLGELIFVVADALQISERPLWEEIRKIMLDSLNSSSEARRALFQPIIQTKGLLSMRQQNRDAHDYLYIDLPNPLTRSDDDVG